MKTIVSLAALSAMALGLGACTPPTDAYGHWGKQARLMNTVSRLDCPEEKGELKRVSAAPDGRSCIYSGDHDSTVELKIVNVAGGDARAALAPIEASTHALVPVNATEAPTPPAAPGAPTPATEPAAASGPVAPTNVSMHPAGAKLPSGRSEDNVQIDLPGIHIHTDDDKANVRVAGIHVNADGKSDKAHVEGKGQLGLGNFTVDAHDGGAVIRMDNSDANIRTRVQFASDNAGPEGDHSAGYIAHGPRSGPLVVAVVRVKGDHGDNDDVFGDARRLVVHNTDK